MYPLPLLRQGEFPFRGESAVDNDQIMFNNKYKRFFKPTDFSLIIADECHRSINGNSRTVFEYFLGYKLGLTATPKDYIKNIDVERLKATPL